MNTEISIPEISVSWFRHYLRRTGNPLAWNQQLSYGSPAVSRLFPQGTDEVGLGRWVSKDGPSDADVAGIEILGWTLGWPRNHGKQTSRALGRLRSYRS